jgi:hypothetical protein
MVMAIVQLRIIAFLLTIIATPGFAAQTANTGANGPASAPASRGGQGTVGNAGVPAEGRAQQDFTLVNNTGHPVISLNVSPASEDSWGADVLHGDTLASGESAQITFPRNTIPCEWDIKATYDDGNNTELRNVDLCTVATVTLTPT